MQHFTFGFVIEEQSSPTFSEIENEILNNRPVLLRITGYNYTTGGYGHVVTVVGTEYYQRTEDYPKEYEYFIVHDNWETTGTDVYLYLDNPNGDYTDYWSIIH